MKHGRDDLEWEQLRHAAADEMRELARRRDLTTYGALNTRLAEVTGWPVFDLETEGGRHALGQLLGDVTREDYPTSGVLLSALCTHKGGNDVGGGFFELATQLGLLPPRSSKERHDELWVSSVSAVYASTREG